MSAVLKEPAVLLRPMRYTDVEAVSAIEMMAYDFPWSEGIFRDCLRVGYSCWVLTDLEAIQGYAIMSVAAQEAHVLNVCVRAAARRRGYARQMITHLLERAVAHGALTALLEVRPSNREALALYRSFGFSEVGVRRQYYRHADGREDALILEFGLAPRRFPSGYRRGLL